MNFKTYTYKNEQDYTVIIKLSNGDEVTVEPYAGVIGLLSPPKKVKPVNGKWEDL